MKQYTILVLLLTFTAVFAFENPSKDSKVALLDIVRVGDKIVEARVYGVIGECFLGRNISCTEDGLEIASCDGSTEETTEVKREVVPCGEDCECGVTIPSDGILLQLFEAEVCTSTPDDLVFGLLDTCISKDAVHMKFTADNTTFKIKGFETETCEGESTVHHSATFGECSNSMIGILTNDLEGPAEPVESTELEDSVDSVATLVASIALVVLSVVVSA